MKIEKLTEIFRAIAWGILLGVAALAISGHLHVEVGNMEINNSDTPVTREACFKSGGASFEDGSEPRCVYMNPTYEEK